MTPNEKDTITLSIVRNMIMAREIVSKDDLHEIERAIAYVIEDDEATIFRKAVGYELMRSSLEDGNFYMSNCDIIKYIEGDNE